MARADEIATGSMRGVVAGGEEICLARTEDGEFHAIGDICTHQHFLLSEGEMEGHEVECPQHASRFDLRTGAVTGFPAVIPARVFPVAVEGGQVLVEV